MNLFIWGAGDKGKRLFRHLDPNDVVAFVDSNSQKIGQKYCDKDIVGIDDFMEHYSREMIVIAHADEYAAMETLRTNDIHNFFLLSDCPGEMQEPNTRQYLKEYVESYLQGRDDYVLYGISLYSLMIDKWIYAKYHIHPLIVPQTNIDVSFFECIKKSFPKLNILDIADVDRTLVREICIVVRSLQSAEKNILEKQYFCTDLYDCSKKISAYRNPLIEKFNAKHNGDSCFIVATGPSLRASDLDVLNNNGVICFSVNSIYRVYSETNWRPDYYVVDDYRAIANVSDMIGNIAKKAAFVGDSCETFTTHEHGDDIYMFHKHYEYAYDTLPKFSDDFAQRSYTGLTVTYTCLQLAVYMGFRNIYLLGVDCNYVNGSRQNYFFNSSEADHMDHNDGGMILAYRAAMKYADENGVKIYNATRGGMLEVFERVSFDSLFDEKVGKHI